MGQASSNLWREESSKRSKAQYVHPSIWIVQNTAWREYKEMSTRFTDLTSNLKQLGKTYNDEEMVRKILRCLPKNKWGPKVTAIEESEHLKKLILDDLLWKILTHEIYLKEDEEETQTNRVVAFKTSNEELYSSKDESSKGDEDSMAVSYTHLTLPTKRIV